MSRDLEVSLWLRLHGGDAAANGVRRFAEQSQKHFGAIRQSVRNAWQDLNGFSMASKLLVAAGGMGLARDTLTASLNFEKSLLEMKQNANMTVTQAAELRALALSAAKDALQTPDEMLQGMKAFARAGEKFENIRVKAVEAAKAATVFRASVEEIANMDFDITDKLKIDPKRLKEVHNMLYYHGNAGRFEAPQLAKQAPELFNAVAGVGVGGERGLNFTGALTQVLMKYASVSEPGKVSTLMQQGLGHIVSPHYVKGLAKVGIDVQKFAPGGKFAGEGGVDGLLALADAMKAKGLQDPFKLGKAGFADQETIKFFRALMQYTDQIRGEMRAADNAAKNDQIGTDHAEMSRSNFGNVKKAQIEFDKAQLGEGAQKGVSAWSNLAGKVAEEPGKYAGAAAGLVGLGLAVRYSRNRRGRLAGEAAGAAEGGGLPGVGGVQQVFVTNWPGGMLSPGEALKQKRSGLPGASVPGELLPDGGEPGKPASKLGKALGVAGKAVGAAGAAVAGWELGYKVIGPAINDSINAVVSAIAGREETLGEAIYDWINKDKEPMKIEATVKVENGQIAATIAADNKRQASRH